ncbi:hypothetical protein ACEPAF_347 [Sanghuangporus sanghuang]
MDMDTDDRSVNDESENSDHGNEEEGLQEEPGSSESSPIIIRAEEIITSKLNWKQEVSADITASSALKKEGRWDSARAIRSEAPCEGSLSIHHSKLGKGECICLRVNQRPPAKVLLVVLILHTIHPTTNPKVAVGAHTDFGSLSFLHNRLGGLQVLPPGYTEWQYVRPIPGHAICNIGDALTLLCGGILRSNLHRVVPPPGAQAAYTRWSLVYFTRPANHVALNALSEQSAMIKARLDQLTPDERTKFETNTTALEWFTRRIKNQRINNRKGPETWRSSRGTEHKPEIA